MGSWWGVGCSRALAVGGRERDFPQLSTSCPPTKRERRPGSTFITVWDDSQKFFPEQIYFNGRLPFDLHWARDWEAGVQGGPQHHNHRLHREASRRPVTQELVKTG